MRTNVRGEPMKPFFKDIAIDREYESGTRSGDARDRRHRRSGVWDSQGWRSAGPRGHHAVKWDQKALVFESGSYTGDSPGTGEWSERREVWSLQPDGRLQVAITTAGSAEKTTTVTLLYRRP